MADGKVVIDVILDDGQVVKGVASVDKTLGNIGQSAKKGALSIGKIVSALGLVALAKKGIDMVKSSLDGAISRYDTLNQFPRVMQLIGFDAEESQAAINKLSKGIDGLPTTLDSVAKNAQNIAILTNDLDGAVDTTIALNNAFLASGASSADAERGLQQYVQMLSKGEVDLQSWRTLQETMGVALNDTAKAFGFTGKSAQNDLYDALKDGKITFDEFNSKIIELSNKTGGFADIARDASGGIKTSWTNMKTAVVKGLADIIGAIDEALGGVGSIEGLIDKVKVAFQKVFAWIVSNIPVAVESIKSFYNALKPWLPLIASITAGILTYIGVVKGIATAQTAWNAIQKVSIALSKAQRAAHLAMIISGGGVKGVLLAMQAAMRALNLTILANPWVLLGAAVVAAAVLVYAYWEPISEFFVNLWNSIKELGLSIWEPIKAVWNTTVTFLKELFSPVTEFFVNLWSSVVEAGTTIWNTLTDTLSTVWQNIQTIASAYWEIIKNVILGPILLLINLVTGDMEEFQSNLTAIWGNIKNAAIRIFDSILNIITSVMDGTKSIIDTVWKFIERIWLSSLEKISNAVGVDFGSIRDNIKNILNAVKNNIDTIWNFIKNTFINVLNFLKALVKGDFEGMKNAIKNQLENIKRTTSQVWENIKEIFRNLIEAITSIVKQKFTDIVNSVRQKMDETKKNIEDGWNKAKAFLEKIDLKQIGKDIIQGLIDGIKSKVKAVGNAIKNVTDEITGKIKSILQIHSPSRVMKELGGHAGQGLADGIEDKIETVDAITERMARAILKITNAMNKEINSNTAKANAEIKKIEQRTQEDINLIHTKAKQAKRKLTQAEIVRIRRLEEDAAKKIKDIETKSAADILKIREKHQKDIDEINKKELANSKNWIERKKKLNDLSLAEELEAWERVQARYIEGTKEREEAEENIYRVKKEIHDKLNSINEEYLKKVEDVNKKLIDEEAKLNDEYNKAFSDRVSAITSFAGLFDEFVYKMETSGYQLLNNLESQVMGLEEWRNTLESLWGKIGDQALMEELEALGPKAIGELKGLNQLSEEQLAQYVELYRQKTALAVDQASLELEGMKQDTAKKIEELHSNTEKQLDALQEEWETKVKAIRFGTKDEFSIMKSDLRTIGEQSIQGMINGLESMRGALVEKIISIASAVKNAVAEAFDINSPSHWMRDMIGKNMMLGWRIGVDNEKTAVLRKSAQMTEWMKPDVPKGFVNRLRGVTAPIGRVTPISAVSGGSGSITNHNSKSYAPNITNYFTPAESTPSESARKQKQQQIRLGMEWGFR